MADEIKKVVTIDAGNSITTLKEYKQHIDDLRGALLALDSTSEEYKDISQEITQEQMRLNEVMKVGKSNTDAAEGSYNKLVQTMAELKKQWRATADEAERADLGNQILDINNQLKDLDASTGNFQRNVGDYANAFEQAFDRVSDSMKANGSQLGVIAGDIKKLIPLIKTATKTATTGLSGVKKALVSTGIGALIVAVGLLVAHWDEVSKAVSNLNRETRKYNETLEATKKAIKALHDEWNIRDTSIKYHLEAMKAQGATEEDMLKWQHDQVVNDINQLKETNADLVKGMEEAQRMLASGWKEKDLFNGNYTAKLEEYNNYLGRLTELEKKESEIRWEMQLNAWQKEADKRDEEKKAAEDAEKEKTEAIKKAIEERRQAYEKEKKAAESLVDTLRKNGMTQLELLDEEYNAQKTLLLKFYKEDSDEITMLTEQYMKKRASIIKEQEDAITAAIVEAAENDKEAMMGVYEAEAEQANFLAENRIAGPNETELQQEQALADAKYEIEKHLIEQKIALQQSYIDELKANNQDVCAEEEALADLRLQLSNLDIARAKEVADFKKQAEKEAAELTKTVWDSASKSVASIFGSLSDMMEEGSAEQKAFAVMETTINTISGAIAAYKSMASIPYVGPALGAAAAAAVGVAGAASIKKIMETKKSSGGSGTVDVPTPEAPNMSAVVSPLLNEEQDIQGMTALNVDGASQGQGSQRVYVVESDIQEVGNRVKVRENESTF